MVHSLELQFTIPKFEELAHLYQRAAARGGVATGCATFPLGDFTQPSADFSSASFRALCAPPSEKEGETTTTIDDKVSLSATKDGGRTEEGIEQCAQCSEEEEGIYFKARFAAADKKGRTVEEIKGTVPLGYGVTAKSRSMDRNIGISKAVN